MPRTSFLSNMVKSFPMKIRWTGTAAIMLTLLLAFTARLKAQTYVPIIYPGSVATEAHGINAFGQIVGTWTDSGGNTHGFLFSAGTYTSLDYPGSIDTVPWGINNAGDIVGYHDNNVGFFLKGGVFTALSSAGLDINNVELIATPGGLIDLNGGFIIIDYPGSLTTNPEAISDAFQIVGDYTDSVNNPHGFSYNAISYTTIDVPGEAVTFLQGVNVPGQIVGYFYDSFARPHAFLDNGGTFTNFDYPGITDYTFAYHINDFGQIVGRAFVPGNPGYIGFLRTPAAINPVPHIHQALFPDSSAPGSAGFTLTVEGTGFVQGAVVNWNGSSRSTSFQNSERLTAAINASDVAAAGTALVTVVNPTPGGGTSNTQFFSITSPVLTPTFNSSTLTAGSSPQRNVAGDFNGDGIMDLAVADATNNQILVMLGNGDGTFGPPLPIVNAGSLFVADFNRDNKFDILEVGSNELVLLLNESGPNFAMNAGAGSSVTVAAGKTANYSLSLGGSGGFSGAIALTCSGAPTSATCEISPSSVTLSGVAPQSAMVSVATTAASQLLPTAFSDPVNPARRIFGLLILVGIAATFVFARVSRRRFSQSFAAACCALTLVSFSLMASCGGSNASSGSGSGSGSGGATGGTATGTYTITVTATSQSPTVTHTKKLTLIVQ